jgi:release factor glutamine methyltransferase
MEGPCADSEEDEETLQQYAARRLELAELPSVDFSASELDSVYEPSDDTFLLLDALEADRERLTASGPALCMEIGCGSGVVITSLSKLLPGSHCIALDINETALAVARRTAELNGQGAAIEFVRGDLLTAFRFFEYRREPSLIDVLVFNPPYVPSEPDEIGLGCKWAPKLSAAWAGGIEGREVIDRLLPQLRRCANDNLVVCLRYSLSNSIETLVDLLVRAAQCRLLANRRIAPGGSIYMVLEALNKPEQVCSMMMRCAASDFRIMSL